MLPHGHYCVPITNGERRIGLLNMYVRDGHDFSPLEDGFLGAAAGVIAGIIAFRFPTRFSRGSKEQSEDLTI